MIQKTKIFYIEDEQALGRIVSDTLTKQGYDVTWEKDGAKVLSYFENEKPDICVLDIMLPNTDGYSLCRTIRGLFPDLPVIFLTAKTETANVVEGFESGGTDYIRKPFSIEELIVRIENQLTLRNGRFLAGNLNEILKIGKYTLDTCRYELKSSHGVIKLSNRDMQLLRMLYANRNGITHRKDLLVSVWGDDSYFNSRNLDVYIKKIRDYFSGDQSVQIITLKGNGYIFLVP
ncbi:MAG TPA: response regulator transcription factor [Bacteroidales bacterium]|nr:response regulator transcription factor [Bacteroidales bacterium]